MRGISAWKQNKESRFPMQLGFRPEVDSLTWSLVLVLVLTQDVFG
jgi:hypothetical protein